MNLKELTIEEINLILVALGKLPLETTLQLFGKIKAQAEEQLKNKTTQVAETEVK